MIYCGQVLRHGQERPRKALWKLNRPTRDLLEIATGETLLKQDSMAQTLPKEMVYRDNMVRRASLFPYEMKPTSCRPTLKGKEEHAERKENT